MIPDSQRLRQYKALPGKAKPRRARRQSATQLRERSQLRHEIAELNALVAQR